MAKVPPNLTAKKRAFLAAYARVASITKAAEIAAVDRHTHYDWKGSDPEYAAEFERTRDLAAEVLEDEAVRRAHDGVQKPVYQGGKRVGYVQEYSDTLLIFLLKGSLPDKYKERGITEHTGAKGAPLFDFSNFSSAELESIVQRAHRGRSASGTQAPAREED